MFPVSIGWIADPYIYTYIVYNVYMHVEPQQIAHHFILVFQQYTKAGSPLSLSIQPTAHKC